MRWYLIIKPNEHYFLEIDSKILNDFIANNIFQCPNKNELFISITQDLKNKDSLLYILVVNILSDNTYNNIACDDIWHWLYKSSEIVIFKAKNAYKSQEQYNELYQQINSEYLIDFKYEDIAKNFQNLGFKPVAQKALNTIGIEIYMKKLQRRRNFEQKQLIILWKIENKLVCIKLNYSDYLCNLVYNTLASKPYAIIEISDNNLIYDIVYKSSYNKSLLKKLMQKWHRREDVLDRMQDFFTYFCCLYKEELDSFLESYNN